MEYKLPQVSEDVLWPSQHPYLRMALMSFEQMVSSIAGIVPERR